MRLNEICLTDFHFKWKIWLRLEFLVMGQSRSSPLLSEDQTNEALETIDDNLDYIKCPVYNLENVKGLSEEKQKSITWLLVQFKERGKPLTEEIDGYLSVYKKNRYGCKQMRWMLITTEAIYVVKPNDFSQCFLRIILGDVENLGYCLDNQAFGIKTKESNHIFYSYNSISAVNSIKIMYYLKYEDFLSIVLTNESKLLMSLITKPSIIEEPDLKNFQIIKENFGSPGEYLITSVDVFRTKPSTQQGKLFISSLAIYFEPNNSEKIKKVMNEGIKRLILLDNHLEVVIKTQQGDLWLAYSQAFSLLKEISEILLTEFKKKVYIKYLSEDMI